MSRWSRIQAALRREKRDVDEAVEELETRANAVLERKERELNATPADRLASEQQRAAHLDDEFEAVRRRIEGGKGD